ncbi:MAG: hypothetical protein ABJC89_06645 [Acidobacteriota bacterium]
MIQPARVALLAALALAAACGKKGPPLAPLHLVPGPATDVSIRRLGPDAQIQFVIPATNLNGPGRAEIDRVEVYAVTVAPGSPPPPNRELLSAKYLVGSIPVKPPPVEGETPPENAPPDKRPGPGEPAQFVEPLTAERLKPVTFAAPAPPKGATPAARPAGSSPAGTATGSVPADASATAPAPSTAAPGTSPSAATAAAGTSPAAPTAPAATGTTAAPPSAPGAAGVTPVPPIVPAAGTTPAAPAGSATSTVPPQATAGSTTVAQPAAPPAPKYPVRIYVLRGMTKRNRSGQPSARVQLPVVPPPAPPTGLTPTVAENAIVLKWTAPPPAEPVAEAVAPAVPIVTTPAVTAPTTQTPVAPPAGNPAAAAPGTTAAPDVPAAPAAITAPPALSFNVYKRDAAAPISSGPIATTEYERTGVTFGSEECFVVRTVETIAAIAIESEPSAQVCVTPRDTFAPAPPKGLAIVAGTGTINLSWDANTEADLAGYIVLRGDGAGGTLQPLTPAPIAGINFEDKTVRAGVRYAYAIVAVDKATPPNRSAPSSRVEETAR